MARSVDDTIAAVIEQANILLKRAVAHSDPSQREKFIIAAGFLVGNLEWCGHITEEQGREITHEWCRRYAVQRGVELPEMNVVSLGTFKAMGRPVGGEQHERS